MIASGWCRFFVKYGYCDFGDETCKYIHPEAYRVTFNSRGFPLRTSAPPCNFYLRTGDCKFKRKCTFHHPEMDASSSSSLSEVDDDDDDDRGPNDDDDEDVTQKGAEKEEAEAEAEADDDDDGWTVVK